jgi:hypothetical protein
MKYAKAVVAFIAPGAVLLIADASDGLTQTELLIAGLTCITAAAAVWAIPNKPVQQD